ncbi:hypothetical protein CORC01_12245, partial [Colletotrichum orchidophilum]
ASRRRCDTKTARAQQSHLLGTASGGLSTVPRTLGAVCGGAIVDGTALLLVMMMMPTLGTASDAWKPGCEHRR